MLSKTDHSASPLPSWIGRRELTGASNVNSCYADGSPLIAPLDPSLGESYYYDTT